MSSTRGSSGIHGNDRIKRGQTIVSLCVRQLFVFSAISMLFVSCKNAQFKRIRQINQLTVHILLFYSHLKTHNENAFRSLLKSSLPRILSSLHTLLLGCQLFVITNHCLKLEIILSETDSLYSVRPANCNGAFLSGIDLLIMT